MFSLTLYPFYDILINLMNAITTIGIIGYGNMGAAIAQQVKDKYTVAVFDNDTSKTSSTCGLTVASNLSNLFSAFQTIIIAIKPQDIEALLKSIKDLIDSHLIISIAAGVKTIDIEEALKPKRAKVIRVMPNIFVKEGAGISCITGGRNVGDDEVKVAEKIFSSLGSATLTIDESKMDAVTAISGSGPGYLAYLLEAKGITSEEAKEYIDKEIMPKYIEAAEDIGLNHKEAIDLANTTGTNLATHFQGHPNPGELKALQEQVTSKGGTTEAAIKKLQAGEGLQSAIKAAFKRAKELAELLKGRTEENRT